MFTRRTFLYLDAAAEKSKNRLWFEKNRGSYEEDVRLPFTQLLQNLSAQIGTSFPEVSFHPARISLPVYREENIPEDGTIVKSFSWAFLSQKRTSLFEWNPGINIYIGCDEITAGLGLYHPSARQMSLLRESISGNPAGLRKILTSKKFHSIWGELTGETFTRFPKGMDPEMKGAEYLWRKQFVVSRKFTRKEVTAAGFSEFLGENLHRGAGFLGWIRETVGVYERDRAA